MRNSFIYLLLLVFYILTVKAQKANEIDSSILCNSYINSLSYLLKYCNYIQTPFYNNAMKNNDNLFNVSLLQSSIIDFTDIPIVISDTPQSENSAFISPLTNAVILNSNNSHFTCSPLGGFDADYFNSSSGGTSWTGSLIGPTGLLKTALTTAKWLPCRFGRLNGYIFI